MIRYSYQNTATRCTLDPALAWVAWTTVNPDRVSMQFTVRISAFALLPDYSPVADVISYSCAYNPAGAEPAAQAYAYLMTLPEFTGGTTYPIPA